MTCDKVLELMTAYYDNELTEEDSLQISIHLEQCAECREIYDYVKAMQEVFSDVPEVDPPAELRKNVMSAIAEEEQSVTQALGWKWRRVVAALVIFTISIATGLYPIVAMYKDTKALSDTRESYNLVGKNQVEETTFFNNQSSNRGTGIEPPKSSPDTGVMQPQSYSLDLEISKDPQPPVDDAEGGAPKDEFSITDEDGAPVDNVALTKSADKLTPNNLPTDSYSATADRVQLKPKWHSIMSDGRILFAITGIFLSLVMLWYARPEKGKEI